MTKPIAKRLEKLENDLENAAGLFEDYASETQARKLDRAADLVAEVRDSLASLA